MTRDEFYRDKQLKELQWWLSLDADQKPHWTRVRLYTDGSADSSDQGGRVVHACRNAGRIRGLLSEVGIRSVEKVRDELDRDLTEALLDGADDKADALERLAASLTPPDDWPDAPDAEFMYAPDY